ncbi:MAG: heat shock protein Hsp20 [Candidatus Jettenia ecosi]|uniref:Heat shock protein Hsp20 n=1 Tax=Candidatus Jettenia ecosi TaxID=2494326 RepID=A0A533QR07_9BACT|nr:MAG: heat shock protein Hsp20 [Candidatus Jettenia ecosi]
MSIDYHIIKYQTDAKQNKLEHLFKNLFAFSKDFQGGSSAPWQPPTDVYETPDEIIVKMSLSGTKPEDIQLAFSNEILTISGFRTDSSPHQKTCFYQVEIRYGYFERSIFIPKPVNTDTIQAVYKDGFLEVVLPKAQQQLSKTLLIKINFQK